MKIDQDQVYLITISGKLTLGYCFCRLDPVYSHAKLWT